MKIGDKIVCYKVVKMRDLSKSEYATTKNKIYDIIKCYHNGIEIIDDLNRIHTITFDFFNKHFYTLKHMRKLKIDKLKTKNNDKILL